MSVERLDQTTTTDLLQVALHRARYDLALHHVQGASSVLEVGTGCGELSEDLSKLPANYVGVEIDPKSAARTRERIRTGEIVETDARDLPFKDGSFSHVVCLEVLEHLGNYRPAIEEIRRCLQPNGKAIISVPYRKKGGKSTQNPYHLYEPGERELVNVFCDAFLKVDVWFQYYEETWWMTLTRHLHLRRVFGLSERYRRLTEGHPDEVARLHIARAPHGLITNLLLIASAPRKEKLRCG
jgi:ubiquinone/menaquinone biosynthesis C-methylase UbiE